MQHNVAKCTGKVFVETQLVQLQPSSLESFFTPLFLKRPCSHYI